VYLPEWKVSGVGQSLEEAYLQYEKNFKGVREHGEKFGLSYLTSEPYPSLKRSDILQELILFFIKVASTAFIVILLFILLLPNITASLRHNIKEIIPVEWKDPKYWALQFPAQINARLDGLEPEEEKKMQNEWDKLIERTSPIVSPFRCLPPAKIKTAR